MPNRFNIHTPITLIANGRSGTSLVQGIFSHHPHFDTCGETASLLFGVWYATEQLKGLVRPDLELGSEGDFDQRCGKAVRASFIATFRAPKKTFWMHKPISIPWVWQVLKNHGLTDAECVTWYWNALNTAFPEAVNITILRHPYDVVLSAMAFWGISAKAAWTSIVKMARILAHPDASVKYAQL
ncbi:MAG: sulfotransferase [Rhodobacteraceae bacterium]|nr:sulfotransferase [Paracoccaceae bacterium]